MLPQLIVIALMLFSLGISAQRSGTPKTGDNNFWVDVTSTIITLVLLWWGGYFDVLIKPIFGK
jgi:hypothetical protein